MNSYNECKAIVELDLDPIKVKLMHKESGEGWSLEQASAVEAEYRRFLYLTKIFPNEMVAPSMNVDTFWHYHILDTLKYARDCEEVYGYFLHHFPYVGLRGGDDLAAQEQAAARMAVLYEKTFGEKYQRSLISEPEVASAYCLRPPPGAASAYCLQPTPTAARVYCLQPTPAYGLNMRVKQDETGFSARFGGTAFSTDPTETVADDDILMNAFFSTRPRLSAEVEAN